MRCRFPSHHMRAFLLIRDFPIFVRSAHSSYELFQAPLWDEFHALRKVFTKPIPCTLSIAGVEKIAEAFDLVGPLVFAQVGWLLAVEMQCQLVARMGVRMLSPNAGLMTTSTEE